MSIVQACTPLILASASPRRKELLSRLGLSFTCLPAAIDETPHPGEQAVDFARRMALEKAVCLASPHPKACVIGADTVVTLDGRIFGKPGDRREALHTLQTLQGKTHQVITGYAIVHRQQKLQVAATETTQVTFGQYSDAILEAYVLTGEPMDKAGAYGIQEAGVFLVENLYGSYSNVVGLPVSRLIKILLQHEIIAPYPHTSAN